MGDGHLASNSNGNGNGHGTPSRGSPAVGAGAGAGGMYGNVGGMWREVVGESAGRRRGDDEY